MMSRTLLVLAVLACASAKLDFDFPVIDCHTHFTNVSRLAYQGNWVKQNYWPSNYSTDSTAAAIMPSKVVFMEAAVNQSLNVKEAEWVQGLAEMQVSRPEIGAIVAYVPIEEGAKCEAVVKEILAKVPLFRGVRRILDPTDPTGKADPCWFNNPDFIAGLQVLADHDLHFELLTRSSSQYDCAADLVSKAPKSLTIVMQHVGGANMTNATEFPIWKAYMQKLAAHPNVIAKVSGVPERAVGPFRPFDDWTEAQVKPYIEAVISSFGADRIVFGGNWFVVTRFSTFLRWTDVLSKIITDMGMSAADMKKFFNTNAQRVYRVAA